MISVIDFYKFEDEHLAVNAAMLLIISTQFKTEAVHFYAENAHIENIKKYWRSNGLEGNNVIFHPYTFRFKKSGGTSLVVKRIANEIISLFRLACTKSVKQTNCLFFFSLSPVTTILFKSLLFKNIPTVITLHGEVDFIKLNNGFTRNILGRFVRISFKLKRKKLFYVVLDEVVKTNLLAYDLLPKENVIAIPHPYLFNSIIKNEYNRPFKIAHLGVASAEKQSYYLFDVAEKCRKEILDNKIKMFLIGNNQTGIEHELIAGSTTKNMLSREMFESLVNSVHFSIFFYGNAYQLTSSGSVLDALNFEKPIIALKNDLFEALFKMAGNIGFLCDDVASIETIVKSVAENGLSIETYRQMQKNMRQYKKDNSLEKIKTELFSQLNLSANW